MIKLYREPVSPRADFIEAEFQDMIFGYEREVITPSEAEHRFGRDHSLPVITNNKKVVSGESLPAYMKELQDLMRAWQAYQGGSCHVDDGGNPC